jgi:ABC-2 type transport system ATP-binding protein
MKSMMISFENVTKKYGEKTAISNLSFQVENGDFFGFLGPNGAGKTTTIKSIIGLVKPGEGRILVDGYDVTKDIYTIRSFIGYVPDSPFVYGKLTAREFMRFVGSLYRMDHKEVERKIDWLVDIFGMKDWADYRSEEYSHGMKQKVVMSAAFLHDPRLLIVDEPTVGLDPPSKKLLRDILKLMQEKGTTVFMSSHDLNEVEELCHKMAILFNGSIVAAGTIDDFRKQAEIEGGHLEDLFLKLTGISYKTAFLE